MIWALRWVARRATSMFHCAGQSHKAESINHIFEEKGVEARSFRLAAERLTTGPSRLTKNVRVDLQQNLHPQSRLTNVCMTWFLYSTLCSALGVFHSALTELTRP